ncbi:TlpA disulfide reductase family protein [Pedobacter nyackensis]|uniref:TlpA disulfide reductase family protein n=1 Tax=Pedobacter nyackensis TaxID=475255 RepID=UPI00292D29E6|nr:TlpA disulfide reductase family protein [Pedobacter nyackensis]
MTKKVLYIVLMSFPLLASAQYKAVIQGRIGKASGQKVLLSYGVNGRMIRDSTYLKQGRFEFQVNFDELVPATLKFDQGKSGKSIISDAKDCFLEPGLLKLESNDSLANARIIKGDINKDYIAFRRFVGMEEAQQLLKAVRATKDEAQLKMLQERRDAVLAQMQNKYEGYVTAHPGSYFSLFALNFMGAGMMNTARIEPLFNRLTPALKESKEGKEFKRQIEATKAIKLGTLAPDFVQPDVLGRSVRLSDFRGKYVLLDFWASWCGPCRKDNPNIVKAYQKYKDKGFTVIGVSLDRSKEAWLQAIESDGLTWTNLSDLNYLKNEAASLYAVRAVPQNYLIDKDGYIIAVQLHGEDLDKKLAEILGSK